MDASSDEVLARALALLVRCESILAQSSFEELAEILRAASPITLLAITRAERPGFFRVLASTGGAFGQILPFRTLIPSSRRVYEVVYQRRTTFLSHAIQIGMEIERSAAQLGMGSYAILPIADPAVPGPAIAGLLVAYREPEGAVQMPQALFEEIARTLAPHVSRAILAGQRERALRILEASGDALVAWDASGRVTDVNRAAELLVGASRSELLGVSIADIFGTYPTVPSSGQRLSLITRSGRRITVAATVSQVDGDPIVSAHALLRDLSEVVAAEHDAAERLSQLRELTEQHMVLLDNAPLLIFRLDPESHEVLYLNRHAEHLFGVPAARALATKGFLRDAHVDPEGITAFEEALVIAKLGQVMPAYEARLKREGGEPLTARGTIYPILGESGRVIGIEGILLDVTNERAVRSRLLQSDRLATVGMLAAGVAHEINNPAAFMLLGLDVLTRVLTSSSVKLAPEVDSQVKQLIGDLRDTGRRIVEIARDMRTFASPPSSTPGRRTLVDVSRTIESALTITRAQIVEKAELELDLSPDLPLVAMDDGRLGQVMVNLLVNAAQAIGEGRNHRGSRPGGDRLRITTRLEQDWVVVLVEDTGIGIRREIAERLFVPFFTTKQPDVGTGLGLAISRTIVESAGGTIAAESPIHDGAGARFIIRLPAYRPSAAVEPVAAPVRKHARRGQVLVVEDEVLLGRALAEQLSEFHEVAVAATGEEALSRLGSQSFDAVLCDVKMPSMGGEDLYRAVLAQNPQQARRFIFMTGIGFGPELERFLSEVNAPMLEKPFAIGRAVALIEQYLPSVPSSTPPSPM